MIEEVKNIVNVNIEILNVKNLRGLRGDAVTTSVKVEFRDKVLGESPKIECKLEEPALLNYKVNISVNCEDTFLLDEITHRPVILTVIESLPKEKKQKDDKSQIIGQCTFDLLPLLRGTKSFEKCLLIQAVPGSPLEQLMSETPQPCINLLVNADKPLIDEDATASYNIVSVTMESIYNAPEAFVPPTPGVIYCASFSLPSADEKENLFVFPGGSVKQHGDKEFRKVKWFNPGSAVASEAIYNNETVVSSEEVEVDVKNRTEKDKPRVTWNTQKRTLIQTNSIKLLKSRISKYRKWPLEIFRIGGSSINKTRKEDESNVNYHGYAMINLSPLLFPGVKQLRGAYKINAFNDADYCSLTGKKSANTDEAVRLANSMMNQSSGPMSGKKTDKKQDKKPPGGKVPGSSQGQNADQDLTSSAGVAGNPPPGDSPVNAEGLQYEEAESYIIIEINLDRPLVEKRKPEEIASKVAEYIPKRDPMNKRGMSADKAIEDYHAQVASIAKQLLTEFRALFEEELKDPDILNNQDAIEQMKQELIYDLNSSGKYFAFKEQLKYSVIKIVREKAMQTSTITDQTQLQSFLRDLFVYLVDELQNGLRRVVTLRETVSASADSNPSLVISQSQLLLFAKEAQTNEQHELADRYFRERIARDRYCSDYWMDYGVYLLGATHSASANNPAIDHAENCFKECVALAPQNLDALVLYGIVCALQNRFEEAETFLEASTTYHSTSIFAWTCRALFYYSIGNEIQLEMSLQEAQRLNNPIKESSTTLKDSSLDEIHEDSEVQPTKNQSEEPIEIPDAPEELNTARTLEENQQADPNVALDTERIQTEDGAVAAAGSTADISVASAPLVEAGATPPTNVSVKSAVLKKGLSKSAVPFKGANIPSSEKSKSSSKELDKEDEVQIDELANCKSIFLKTAQILLKFKAYEFVEKCLAQELIYQSEQKDNLSDDQRQYLIAEYHFVAGCTHMGFNRLQEAEEAFFECASIRFDSADTMAQLGHLRFLLGDHKAAKSFYTQTLNLTTDLSEPHPVYMRLASLYLIENNFVESKQTFLFACKKNPTCLSWLGVGIACYRLDELSESEEALAEANILNNENPEVWGYLSLICLRTQRKIEAEQSYKYAIRLGLQQHSATLLNEIQELQVEVGFGNPTFGV